MRASRAADRGEAAGGDDGPVGDDGVVRDVTVTGDGIRLGQFLKLANVVGSGSDVKALLADGQVAVNGEVEPRRGRQLVRGDVVSVDGGDLRLA